MYLIRLHNKQVYEYPFLMTANARNNINTSFDFTCLYNNKTNSILWRYCHKNIDIVSHFIIETCVILYICYVNACTPIMFCVREILFHKTNYTSNNPTHISVHAHQIMFYYKMQSHNIKNICFILSFYTFNIILHHILGAQNYTRSTRLRCPSDADATTTHIQCIILGTIKHL